ncbi:ABC transporter substrate-binding protein [Candidatus Woesearchaeota archaeon]|nr:ABC transporter substrate-binding protein [Candidatus Woesearchaeota archaeon]
MKSYKIILWSLVFLLVITGIVIALIPGENNEQIQGLEKIKVAYKPTSHYLSVFIAKENGFFLEEGLDAELINFDSSNQAMDALLNGQVDVSRGGLFLQLKIEAEKPGQIKTFLVNNQSKENFVDYIIINKDSGINSIYDLKGKKIGTNTGLIEESYIKQILKYFNLENDVQVIGIKPALVPNALETKQVDAIFVYEPEANIAINKGFGRVLIGHPVENYLLNPWIGGGVYIKASLIKENPKKKKKIMNAFYKAGQFIKHNPDESKIILAKYTGLDQTINYMYFRSIHLQTQELRKLHNNIQIFCIITDYYLEKLMWVIYYMQYDRNKEFREKIWEFSSFERYKSKDK